MLTEQEFIQIVTTMFQFSELSLETGRLTLCLESAVDLLKTRMEGSSLEVTSDYDSKRSMTISMSKTEASRKKC